MKEASAASGWFERFFKLKENHTNISTEVRAGITTFLTMAYILSINPMILSASGMDAKAVFTATAVGAVLSTLIMALYANYPFGIASGMGLNAFFVYTVVFQMGKTWQFALTAVFIEGLIFMALSAVKFREAIFDSIPLSLKKAVSVGIGLFIALLGFVNAGIVKSGKIALQDGQPTLVPDGLVIQLGNILEPAPLLAIFGILLTGYLLAKNIKGALFIGILLTTLVGIPLGLTVPPANHQYISLPPSLAPVAFQLEFSQVFSWDMMIVVFTFLFVDIFDTIGCLSGVASKAKMLDSENKLPRLSQALMADAVGTTVGALLGTSTQTTFVESASGIAEGGRTGLTALTVAGMFFLSLFFFPIFGMIPAAATAPSLIIVGLFMLSPVKDIDLDDFTEAIPAFLTIVMMPFASSIAEGIVFGMVSYVILKTATGRKKEVSWFMYMLAFLFIVKHIVL